MLKKPHNSVSHAYVGVRDCKNKWWLVAWLYQSPVGQYHLFVFPGLRVINPSCSFPSCENVKGETPPPVTSPSCRQAPTIPALQGLEIFPISVGHQGWAELLGAGMAQPRGWDPSSAKQVRAGLARTPWEEKGLYAAFEPHFHALTGQCWRQLCLMSQLTPETTAPKQPGASCASCSTGFLSLAPLSSASCTATNPKDLFLIRLSALSA